MSWRALGLGLALFGLTGDATAQAFWPFDSANPQVGLPQAKRTPSNSPKSQSLSRRTKEAVVPTASGSTAAWHWRITRASWIDADEKAYEYFVAQIGESGCRSVQACLTGTASNPMYSASNPPGMTFYADCADLPYMLRAYFAWKNGLPFSYSSAVSPISATHDIRYTTLGNRIIGRHDITGPAVDTRRAIPRMVDVISSAHYRYPPTQVSDMLPDHYPVRITRQSIRPGTIIYDPNGHVAVVYKVGDDGRIHYIDTHPDNSLTRGVYGRSFVRASPGMGAGFKRWRPQMLVGAKRDSDGHLSGGSIVLAADRSISDWSDEQIYGTASPRPKSWSAARFVVEDQRLDYYEFVRKRLAGAGFRYNPLDETRTMVRALCEDAKYRVDAVNAAIKAGIHLRPQPSNLPLNIYGAEGDWETYSTPSRDARLKTAFKELRDEVAKYLSLVNTEPGRLDYAGSHLKEDLARIWREDSTACRFGYAKSDGTLVALDLPELKRRLFRLSFDPHHCAERRWGGDDTAELAVCADGDEKHAWYEAEQRLRNQIERTYQTRMGFSLSQLRARAQGSGVDMPPDIDIEALLALDR
jgi:hypothetical protein